MNGDGQSENHAGRKGKSGCSSAERTARAEFQTWVGHPLSDSEWAKQRNRLVEFVTTLARWDLEQRNRQRVDSASGSVKPAA